jgi:glycine amidinotransferase/scyllo-inosamine-4-phosphate amidinotransferase 1
MLSSNNEWDTLKEVVVGSASWAQFPVDDSQFMKEHTNPKLNTIERVIPDKVIDETNEDLQILADTLTDLGVKVHRPKDINYYIPHAMYSYCPRDNVLIVGDLAIEAPMYLDARKNEILYLEDIKHEAIANNQKWIAAPIARSDKDPIFDAANICRVGNDLLYLVSNSGNRAGAQWLQSVVGSEYKVHICDMYKSTHIDSTITPLRDGFVVLNGSRVNSSNCPTIFDNWDKLYVNNMVEQSYHNYPYASKWVGMNMLSVGPDTVIVDAAQTELIKDLESAKFTVIPLTLRHSRTLGGGFHCVTLCLHRDS